MKHKLRWFLIAVAVLIVILIAIPFLIDVNQFRPTVEEKLSTAIGRQVHVGNLGLSLITGSLSADNLSIADDPAFGKSAFLTAKSLKVGVEILPLIFSRQLHVTSVDIENPEVTLMKNPAGRWNFSSLGAGTGKRAERRPTIETAGFAFDAAPTDLAIGKLVMNDGRLTVGSTNSSRRSVYDHVNLTASDVSPASQFPMTLTASLPGGGNLKLDGELGPLDNADAALSPLDAKLNVRKLDIGKTGFVDPTAIAGIVDLDSTVASKNGEARARGHVNLDKLQLVKGGSPSPTPVGVDFASTYYLTRSAGVLNEGTVKIGKAIAHLAGTYDLKGETPVVNLKINGKDMPAQDLEAVLPAVGVMLPKGASLTEGTTNANLDVAGPADKLVTTGDVGIFNAKLSGFDMGSKMAVLAAFGGIQKGADTKIDKFTSNVRVAPEGIESSNLDLVLPAIGELTGNGTISQGHALNFKMLAALGTAAASSGGKHRGGIPFKIEGTTADPRFIPDIGGMLGGLAGEPAGALGKTPGAQGIADTIGGLLGKKKKP